MNNGKKCLEMPPQYNVVLAISELLNTVCTVKEGAKISRDGRYNTTIIDTIDTDTSSCSINTWFLATLIPYSLIFFLFVWGRGAVSYGMVSYRITSAWYRPCTSKNQPPLTISNSSFDSFIQLYSMQSFPKLQYRGKLVASLVQIYLHPQGFIALRCVSLVGFVVTTY